MDGDPEGRMMCELSNWNGKAYRIPRGKVKDCSDREDLESTSVYLLFGKMESTTLKPKVYIGETEYAVSRLVSHVKEKDFWNEAVVFISKDDNLNKAHIKYLESRLYEIALQAGRYELVNDKTPTRSAISESDQAEMEEFLEYIKLLVNTMGFRVFEPLIHKKGEDSATKVFSESNKLFETNDCFYIKAARGADGRGKRVTDGFVVLAGSEIAKEIVPSCPKGTQLLRDELIDGGIIAAKANALVFEQDHLFSSPSSAAGLIMGRSANGLKEWKDSKGNDLSVVEEIEITDV